MGYHYNVDYEKFPAQGVFLNKECKVCFNYADRTIKGKIVRDDMEEPFKTIIQLEDGRFVMSTECMYSIIEIKL